MGKKKSKATATRKMGAVKAGATRKRLVSEGVSYSCSYTLKDEKQCGG